MLEVIGVTFDLIGKLMISFTAIMVHHRFLKEHKVDAKVLMEMRREQFVGIIGILFLISGYVMKLYHLSITTAFAQM